MEQSKKTKRESSKKRSTSKGDVKSSKKSNVDDSSSTQAADLKTRARITPNSVENVSAYNILLIR